MDAVAQSGFPKECQLSISSPSIHVLGLLLCLQEGFQQAQQAGIPEHSDCQGRCVLSAAAVCWDMALGKVSLGSVR